MRKRFKRAEIQLEALDRKEIARKSIEDYGAVVIVESIKDATEVVNRIAPEHLELAWKNHLVPWADKECGGNISRELFLRAFGGLFVNRIMCFPPA